MNDSKGCDIRQSLQYRCRQSTGRQVADMKRYAAVYGMEIVDTYEEKAFGAKMGRAKPAKCLAFLKGGGADTLALQVWPQPASCA